MNPLEAMLVGKGIDELIASQWAKFLITAFEALRSAEATLNEPAAWALHVARKGALLNPRRTRAERGRRLPSEEGLTCGLAETLWAVRVGAQSDHDLRRLEIQFHTEARMPSRRRTGKNARRTDIWIRSALGPDAPNIVMEAKLIVTDKELREQYLGPGGLGCFTELAEPYTKGPLAGLIAYTVEDGDLPWPDRIVAAMAHGAGHTPTDMPAPGGDRGATDLWSEAERTKLGLTPIGIAHLVMRFAAVPVE